VVNTLNSQRITELLQKEAAKSITALEQEELKLYQQLQENLDKQTVEKANQQTEPIRANVESPQETQQQEQETQVK